MYLVVIAKRSGDISTERSRDINGSLVGGRCDNGQLDILDGHFGFLDRDILLGMHIGMGVEFEEMDTLATDALDPGVILGSTRGRGFLLVFLRTFRGLISMMGRHIGTIR